jgi:signal peptidase I
LAKSKPKAVNKPKTQINTLPLYALLIVLFVLYIVFQHGAVVSVIVGAALLLTLVAVILIETLNGIREFGFRRNVMEIILVVLVVVGIWFALQFFLATKYPLDVVPSCSMLPSLQRGDMLLLHGITNPAQLGAPVIDISKATYAGIVKEASNGELACIAYKQSGNSAQVSQYMEPGYTLGLYSGSDGGSIVALGSQSGPITYQCGVTGVKFNNGTTEQIVYTSGISIGGQSVSGDRNNSVVVYETIPQDVFYQDGDSYIVHRAYAVLNVSGSYYVLTKGDNNPGLDMQYGNYPVNLTYVQGKVIASVPYLGYLKLILSSRFVEPSGCNSTIQN